MLRDRLMRILMEPAATETAGGGGTETATAPAKPAEATPPDLKAAEQFVAKHGSAAEAVRVLMGENYSHREKNRALEARVPEGAVVLKADQAKAWEAYRQLGEPAELKTAKEERTTFAARVATFEREKVHAAAAEVTGFKPAVLNKLAEQDRIEIEVVDEQGKDGKPVKVARVKDGDKTTALDQYAASKWADFLPALKGGDGKGAARAGGTPPPSVGSPPPRTQAAGPPARRRNVF